MPRAAPGHGVRSRAAPRRAGAGLFFNWLLYFFCASVACACTLIAVRVGHDREKSAIGEARSAWTKS